MDSNDTTTGLTPEQEQQDARKVSPRVWSAMHLIGNRDGYMMSLTSPDVRSIIWELGDLRAKAAELARVTAQLDALRAACNLIPDGCDTDAAATLDDYADDINHWGPEWAKGIRQQAAAIRAALGSDTAANGGAE